MKNNYSIRVGSSIRWAMSHLPMSCLPAPGAGRAISLCLFILISQGSSIFPALYISTGVWRQLGRTRPPLSSPPSPVCGSHTPDAESPPPLSAGRDWSAGGSASLADGLVTSAAAAPVGAGSLAEQLVLSKVACTNTALASWYGYKRCWPLPRKCNECDCEDEMRNFAVCCGRQQAECSLFILRWYGKTIHQTYVSILLAYQMKGWCHKRLNNVPSLVCAVQWHCLGKLFTRGYK